MYMYIHGTCTYIYIDVHVYTCTCTCIYTYAFYAIVSCELATYLPNTHEYRIQIMKRDRFSLVLRFLHLNDSSQYIRKGEPGYDPLFKLRPFIEPLFQNFQSHYTLSKEVCIDESMIAFKGRLSFIQYMSKKLTKWGMKAFVLVDSQTGYLYNWHLYTGM